MATTVNAMFTAPTTTVLNQRRVHSRTHLLEDLGGEVEKDVDARNLLEHGQADPNHQGHPHAGLNELSQGTALRGNGLFDGGQFGPRHVVAVDPDEGRHGFSRPALFREPAGALRDHQQHAQEEQCGARPQPEHPPPALCRVPSLGNRLAEVRFQRRRPCSAAAPCSAALDETTARSIAFPWAAMK